jgi:hypothetical protein
MAHHTPIVTVYYPNVAGLIASSGAQSYVTHPCQCDRDLSQSRYFQFHRCGPARTTVIWFAP